MLVLDIQTVLKKADPKSSEFSQAWSEELLDLFKALTVDEAGNAARFHDMLFADRAFQLNLIQRTQVSTKLSCCFFFCSVCILPFILWLFPSRYDLSIYH